MRHTLSILVENRFGELARIVSLFSARGYNIESLTVAETLDPEVSRITLVTSGDERIIAQITRQLEKQVRVISVTDLSLFDHVEREMALVHVITSDTATRQEVLDQVRIFHARVIGTSETGITVEATGERSKVDALLLVLRRFGIEDMVRAGTVAIKRSDGIGSASAKKQEAVC